MTTVNHWLSQQPSYEQPLWGTQRPSTPPSFYLRTPDDRDMDAVTWTRATAKSVTDYQGNIWQALSGEVTWQGYRRVQNNVLCSEPNANYWSTAGTGTKPTVGSGTLAGMTATTITFTSSTSTGYANARAEATGGASALKTATTKGGYWRYRMRVKLSRALTGSERVYFYWTGTGGARQTVLAASTSAGSYNYASSEYTATDGAYLYNYDYSPSLTVTNYPVVYLETALGSDLVVTITEVQMSYNPISSNPSGAPWVSPNAMTDEYVSVGVLSTPYHGAKVDGVRYFATDEQGRLIDGTRGYERAVTGEWEESSTVTPIAPGLSIGSEQTNRITYSSDLSNAAWTKRGACTATAAYDAQVGVYSTVTGIGATGVNDVYVPTTGFTGGARTEVAFMLRTVSTSGTLYVVNPNGSTLGRWTVDLSLVSTTRFERIDRFHPAVSVVNEFIATAGGGAGVWFYASSGTLAVQVSLGTQVEAKRVQSLIYSSGSVTAKNGDVGTPPFVVNNNAGSFVAKFTFPGLTNAGSGSVLIAGYALYKAGDLFGFYDGSIFREAASNISSRTVHSAAVTWSAAQGKVWIALDGALVVDGAAYDGSLTNQNSVFQDGVLLHERADYRDTLTTAQLKALSS